MNLTCSSKVDKISLVHHINQTNRWKEQKNGWAIKSGNGHKNL